MDVDQCLRDAGLRVTRPRRAVLQVLDEAPAGQRHLLVSQVVRGATGLLGRVSTQAVYDCLDALTRAGLVRRVETAGPPARYEVRAGDNHHHLACRRCGEVVDVDCAVGEAPCLEPATRHGFDLEEAEVVFWGTCPSCSGEDATEIERNPA
jgi:Fe2+ or Zn2+ uptake regulation protein